MSESWAWRMCWIYDSELLCMRLCNEVAFILFIRQCVRYRAV